MGYKVAVVGATGNVGRELLGVMAEREFPADEVVALASSRSLGKEVSYGLNRVLKVQDLALKIFGSKATAVLTSVPGPKEVLYFCGRQIHSFFFWVPQAARLGMGLSLLSYAGSASLGVVTDTGLVEDPQAIVDGFHIEFDLMSLRVDTGS